jgi:hypothetical protein
VCFSTYSKRSSKRSDSKPFQAEQANKFALLADEEMATKHTGHSHWKRDKKLKLKPANKEDEDEDEDTDGGKGDASNTSDSTQLVSLNDDSAYPNNMEDDRMSAVDTGDDPPGLPKPPVVIELSTQNSSWCKEDSDGNTACSGNKHTPPKKNLQDVLPPSSVTMDPTSTSYSSLSMNTLSSVTIDWTAANIFFP